MEISVKPSRDILSTLTDSISRLQEETWRIGGVWTSMMMLDLEEIFSESSKEYF